MDRLCYNDPMEAKSADPEYQRMIDKANIDSALAEFASLRAEILMRLTAMQTVLTLQITVSGAVFSYALAGRTGTLAILLVVPVTTCMLAMRYVSQHVAMKNLSQYIHEHLNSRVPGGLSWEGWVNQQRPRLRAYGWTGPLLLSFPGIALTALVWFIVSNLDTLRTASLAEGDLGLAAVWTLGVLATGFTWWLVRSITGGRLDNLTAAAPNNLTPQSRTP